MKLTRRLLTRLIRESLDDRTGNTFIFRSKSDDTFYDDYDDYDPESMPIIRSPRKEIERWKPPEETEDVRIIRKALFGHSLCK